MSDREDLLPRARTENILARRFDDELLVYDYDRNVATSLNAGAAGVWDRCDGHTSPAAIAEALSKGAPASGKVVDERAVWVAVDKLSRASLLEVPITIPPSVLGASSRRELLRGLGLAAAAVPVVMSITAPTPAAAATCIKIGDPCTNSEQCCVAGGMVTCDPQQGKTCQPN
jgi:glycine/D-amino acid oxidase-like deaminating enzyme